MMEVLMAIRIITDSASDLPADKAKLRRVTKIPMSIHFGPASYFDGETLSCDVFYQLLTAGQHHPTTSQPTPEAFLQVFSAARDAGDSVVCILLSSELSGTYQSAFIARQMCEYDEIYLVDSLSATGGMQILINYACKLRDSGLDAAGIAAELERLKERIRIFAVVDTLEYLRKGGRLSAAQAAIGTVSRLKPIIAVREGKVAVASKAFGIGAATKSLLKLLAANPVDDVFPSYFLYSSTPEKKEELIPLLRQQNLLPSRLHDCQIGATIGTHVGPGAFGFAYITRN